MKLTKLQQLSLFFLRISLGFLFFYAGISKLLNPNWTAAGYLKGAQTLTPLYQWLASPQNITWVNFLNEWGLTLIGIALILGIFVRFASVSGILMMILYYVPILKFPFAGSNSLLVDQHIIYIFVLFLLISFNAGEFWGFEKTVLNILTRRSHYSSKRS